MKSRLGVALAIAFALHVVLFTLLHVRRGPPPVVAVKAPTELEMTSVALGEAAEEPSTSPGRSAPPSRSASAWSSPSSTPPSSPSTSTGADSEGGVATSLGAGSEAGSGVGVDPGTGGPGLAPTITPAPVDRSALLRQILSRVHDARRYPEAARRRELEGAVHVRFTIGADGRPASVSTGSADPLLQAAAREAIERAAPFPVVDGPIELDVDYTLSD